MWCLFSQLCSTLPQRKVRAASSTAFVTAVVIEKKKNKPTQTFKLSKLLQNQDLPTLAGVLALSSPGDDGSLYTSQQSISALSALPLQRGDNHIHPKRGRKASLTDSYTGYTTLSQGSHMFTVSFCYN